MEEDVLGPREEVVGDRYTRCTRCGEVMPIDTASLAPVDGPHATQLVELCRQCREDLDSGDALEGLTDEDLSG